MKSNAIRHDTFWAGISQDDRLQQKGEYTYWRDINIRQWQFVELENLPTNLVAVSNSWKINCMSYYSTTATFFLGCSDGVIRSTIDWVTYSTLYTLLPNADPVLAMLAVNGTLFFWSENGMYYRPTYTDGAAWVDGANTVLVTTNLNQSPYRQVIHYSSKLIYFTNGKKIGYIDSSTPWTITNYGSFTSGGGAFEARDKLVWLTEHANSFWAYDVQWRMYVIDQWIQAVSSVKNLKEPVIAVYNNSDFDLTFTASGEFYKAVYINGWVWPNSQSLLRRYLFSQYVYMQNGGGNLSNGIRFNFIAKSSLDFSFAENNTITYFIANEAGYDVIYSYGRKNNSLPQSLSIKTSKRSDGTNWGTISAIWVLNSYLYIAWNTGVTRYVERIYLEDTTSGVGDNFADSWYIITRVDSAWIFEKPKQAWELLIGASIPNWTSIKIYYSKDETAFTLLWSEIWYEEIQGWTGTATLIRRTIPSKSFNEMAIKIELLTSDPTVSPRLFSLEYEPSIVKLN